MESLTGKFKVLLVDDEPIIREGLRVIIDWEKYGFTVCGEAVNGQDALQQIKKLHPDLIIVDIKMPVIDGLELIEQVRAQNPTTQAIILTGYSEFEYAQRAVEVGAISYVLKPIDEDELRSSITRAHRVIAEQGKTTSEGDKLILDICWGETEMDLLRMLCMAMDFNNKERIKELLGEFTSRHGLLESSPEQTKATYLHVFFAALSSLRVPERLGEERVQSYQEVLNEVYRYEDAEELYRYFTDKLAQISDSLVLCSAGGVVKKITDYLERNYQERTTLEHLAQNLNYTSAYLGKVFKARTGLRFSQYLTKIRLEKSKELLEQGVNVGVAAEQVGYRDVDYFHTKFKQQYGVSPSTFKKSVPGP